MRARPSSLVAMLAAVSLLAACQPAAPAASPTTAPKPAEATKPAAQASPAVASSPAPGPAASPATKPNPSPSPGASPSPAAKPGASGPVQTTSRIDPSLASVWAGKTVTWVVGANPGGGYDTWSRLMARMLPKHLPGNPNIIVQNMDGANHRVATNFIYQARPDGLTIGMVDRFIPYFQLIGEGPEQGVRYDVTKINWLGSGDIGTQILTLRARDGLSPTNLAPLEQGEWKVANQDPGSSPHQFLALSRALLGWKLVPIFGFPGNPEIALSVQRGETDGVVGDSDTSQRLFAEQFANGQVVAVVQYGPQKPGENLRNTKTMMDLLANKPMQDQQLFQVTRQPFQWSRSYLAPPGMPENMVSTLRAAILMTLQDPEFLAEAQRLRLEVNPVPGEEVQRLIMDYLNTPKSFIDRMRAETEKDVQ